jgi:hypothetical protein
MSRWVRFNVFFEMRDDEDHDQMYDDLSEAILAIIDPACAAVEGDVIPEGHVCTRNWTAGAASLPSLTDSEAEEDEWDDLFDELEASLCDFCGRPLPDRTHEVPTIEITGIK